MISGAATDSNSPMPTQVADVNFPAIAMADRLHRGRATGWNTWDTRSVLRHVLLPEGLCVSLGFSLPDKLIWLEHAFFGRQELPRTAGTQLTSLDRKLPTGNLIEIQPGGHAYDGSYTSLELSLRGARFKVETAAQGREWVAVIEPLQQEPWMRALVVQLGVLWGREGFVRSAGAGRLEAHLPGGIVTATASGAAHRDANLPVFAPHLAVRLDEPVVVCAGCTVSLDEARRRIAAGRQELEATHAAYGDQHEAHAAMQSCLAWNVIYEPRFERVLCPVARDWNCKRGGYAVFCWDSFLTAWMIAQDDPGLGYACLLETFREMVDDSFVSNVVQGSGRRALDRSQPPVGSLALLGMHRRHPNREALAAAWPALLAWNRWWHEKRRNRAGSLSLGSHPFTPRIGDPAEFVQPNTAAGAALESGLDNLPIYDHAPFDPVAHQMLTEDVGLNSLYVGDCECLATIARILGHGAECAELEERARDYRQALRRLWWEEKSTFRDRRLDTGEWQSREAVTCFYPLLAGAADRGQASRLVEAHLLNPEEFGLPWMLPAVPRTDPAFPEQLYQRGRIWPPNNFLTYLGLRRYGLAHASRAVADNGMELLLRNWRENRVVAENLSAIDGIGGVGAHTHPLYGWGGLMAFMALIEAGHAPSPLEDVHGRE